MRRGKKKIAPIRRPLAATFGRKAAPAGQQGMRPPALRAHLPDGRSLMPGIMQGKAQPPIVQRPGQAVREPGQPGQATHMAAIGAGAPNAILMGKGNPASGMGINRVQAGKPPEAAQGSALSGQQPEFHLLRARMKAAQQEVATVRTERSPQYSYRPQYPGCFTPRKPARRRSSGTQLSKSTASPLDRRQSLRQRWAGSAATAAIWHRNDRAASFPTAWPNPGWPAITPLSATLAGRRVQARSHQPAGASPAEAKRLKPRSREAPWRESQAVKPYDNMPPTLPPEFAPHPGGQPRVSLPSDVRLLRVDSVELMALRHHAAG